MAQTEIVRKKIADAFPDVQVELCEMSTKGDEQLDRSLTSFGGKGVFTQELEAALLDGRIDLAVHSAKDMPMNFPDGLVIGAALTRGSVEDVVVTKDGTRLCDLKPGSVVGTGSLRREIQIRALNPLVQVRSIRGNVETRLRKLTDGEYDAVILAAAGLERLHLVSGESFFFEPLSAEQCLPAAGQAILAVETREGHLPEIMEQLNDLDAMAALCAERAYLKEIGGSCNAPAAALAVKKEQGLSMEVMFAPDGIHMKRSNAYAENGVDLQKAEELGKKLGRMMRRGKVWLVGAGPGNRHLATEQCLSCIRKVDVLVYDNLAGTSLLNEADPNAELIYAGKRASCHHLKQEETNQLLIRLAEEGKQVVRLKGGDPFVFGRGGEEAQALQQAGIEYEIVPGVSSCCSVPAYAGIPVTHREYASSFHVITGQEGTGKEKSVLDYETIAKEEGTLLFLMGLQQLPHIAEQLIRYGKDPKTPAAVIQEGTTAHQKVAEATLDQIAEEADRQQIRTPAVFVVGEVAALRKEIGIPMVQKPLMGKRILLTASERMTAHLAEVLEEEGAEAVPFSLIRTEGLESEALDQVLSQPESYQWMVFTSENGVELFFDRFLKAEKDIRSLFDVRFAVIGEGTARALRKRGFKADFIPSSYTSRKLAEEWVPLVKAKERVVLLRAEEASNELDLALEGAGISFLSVPLYYTAVETRKAEELNRIMAQMDYVVFCSASAVRAFRKMRKDGVDSEKKTRILCIGPVTAKAAEEEGLSVWNTAVTYTAEGIRDLLLYEAVQEKKEK